MSEAYRDYNEEECYISSSGVIRPGDRVVVIKIYADPETRALLNLNNVTQLPAFFDGYRPAFTDAGEPLFEGVRLPHIIVPMEDHEGPYDLEILGSECDWTTPDTYSEALDEIVAKVQIPDYPPISG